MTLALAVTACVPGQRRGEGTQALAVPLVNLMQHCRLLLMVSLLASCLPGEERGVNSPCDLSHPCRSFLSCSTQGVCEIKEAGPDGSADAASADAAVDGRPVVDAVADAVTLGRDAALVSVPDGGNVGDATSSISLTCKTIGDMRPPSPVRMSQTIICHDESRLCDLLRGTAAWPTNTIPVCVVDDDFGSFPDALVNSIKAAVESTWGRWLPITFTGWERCACAPAGTIALLSGSGLAAEAAAGFSNDVAVPVRLAATDEDLSQRVAFAFGRALGVVYFADFGPVTAREILRGQRVYGLKPAGSLVDTRGRCLKNAGGAPVVTTCEEQLEYAWLFDASGKVISTVDPYPCLTMVGSGPAIAMGSCGSEQALKVPMVEAQWRALGNMCVKAQSASIGATMVVNACDEIDALSKWDFLPGQFAIRLFNTNLCVSSPSNVRLGDRPDLRPCTFDKSQRFVFERGHVLGDASLCFNVGGGKPVDGQSLIFWNGCHHASLDEDKIFFVRGRMRTAQGCLSSATAIAGEVPVYVDSCVSSPSNLWEYRW